jgi:four helix bundle protein
MIVKLGTKNIIIMRNYQKLDAWKSAMQLTKLIYTLTKAYPKKELYALTSQTKRAVVSIPSNIAEGMGRQYKKDTIQFLHIARGSIYELETILNIALMVEIIDDTKFQDILPLLDDTFKLLNGLINYMEKANLK